MIFIIELKPVMVLYFQTIFHIDRDKTVSRKIIASNLTLQLKFFFN